MEPILEETGKDIYDKMINDMMDEVYTPSCDLSNPDMCESCQ